MKPVPLGKQFGGITLSLTEPFDLDCNGFQGALDSFEARVLAKRVRSDLWSGATEPIAPAVDGDPKGDRSCK